MDKKPIFMKAVMAPSTRDLAENHLNGMIQAQHGDCKCSGLDEQIVHLGKVHGDPAGQFDMLDSYYCKNCNHTWMEP